MSDVIDSPDHLFIDLEPHIDDFREAVLEGLGKPQKAIPSKFFYDELGSKLFEEICTLEEYYPTRTELSVLRDHASEIVALTGHDLHLVEYGSGEGVKVRVLIDAMDNPRSYVAIDISKSALLEAAERARQDYPQLPLVSICADYSDDIDLPELGHGEKLGFFPGSTIGNFRPEEAVDFLRHARHTLDGGAMVIGVDLKKDEKILNAAYDDAEGVTAQFNMNLLARINRELDGNFDLSTFKHRAMYNAGEGRVEMHLVSGKKQDVSVGGQPFHFEEGEYIHTENSYKFTVEEFKAIAAEAGFQPATHWVDENNLFSVHYLEA